MANPDTPSAVERYSTIAFGGLLLLIATSLFGWGVRLTLAGLFSAAGWPPGLGQLLLPVNLTALVIGFGAWRLLIMGLPERIFGLALGWAVVALFGVAGAVGAMA